MRAHSWYNVDIISQLKIYINCRLTEIPPKHNPEIRFKHLKHKHQHKTVVSSTYRPGDSGGSKSQSALTNPRPVNEIQAVTWINSSSLWVWIKATCLFGNLFYGLLFLETRFGPEIVVKIINHNNRWVSWKTKQQKSFFLITLNDGELSECLSCLM